MAGGEKQERQFWTFFLIKLDGKFTQTRTFFFFFLSAVKITDIRTDSQDNYYYFKVAKVHLISSSFLFLLLTFSFRSKLQEGSTSGLRPGLGQELPVQDWQCDWHYSQIDCSGLLLRPERLDWSSETNSPRVLEDTTSTTEQELKSWLKHGNSVKLNLKLFNCD